MKSYFVPSSTLQLDLGKSEKELLGNMHYKTRYNIVKLTKGNMVNEVSSDVEKFAAFWQMCALRQRGMFLSQKNEIIMMHKAFEGNSDIILIKDSDSILAGILLLYAKGVAYYMYAASTIEGKSKFAPTLAAWSAITLSKNKGCRLFDFEGIYDDRFPVKSWIGFTRFKKSFGGREIRYPGSYCKNYGIFKFFA